MLTANRLLGLVEHFVTTAADDDEYEDWAYEIVSGRNSRGEYLYTEAEAVALLWWSITGEPVEC